MSLLYKNPLLFLAVALMVGCASPQKQAEGPVLKASIEEMRPHFECVLLFDQLGESDKVSKGIDDASTIGEKNGLSPNQIMSAYSSAKEQATGLVLEQAIEIASEDPERLPRLDGTFPPPKAEDELQAWKDMFESQCAPDDTAT